MEMGKFTGVMCAAAIAALGVVGTGCDDEPELIANTPTGFDVIDTNGDGRVSTAEWNAAFNTWDVNGDGMIAQSEYVLNGGFTTLDVDANGLLTAAEWN